ncbi:MAG: guanylate kinase [Nitrospirota bacterium]
MQEKKSRGTLFIVSAPSGAGKTTLCKKIVSILPNLKFSVSYTTRQKRKGEINGKDYKFISREKFKQMIDEGEFIEWAEIYEEFYGSSKKTIEELLSLGVDVLLDIDTQGAMQIKKKYKEGAYIFVLPPSLDVLKERLEKRKTDSKEEIEKRLRKSISEIKNYQMYDYVIINNKLEDALKEFEAIIISQRISTKIINPLWVEKKFFKSRR